MNPSASACLKVASHSIDFRNITRFMFLSFTYLLQPTHALKVFVAVHRLSVQERDFTGIGELRSFRIRKPII